MSKQQENFYAIIHGLRNILADKEKVKSIRPSQQKVLKDFVRSPEQFKTGIFDLATAFGKTRIMALLADAYHQNANQQIVVVEPTQELVHQIAEEFSEYFSDQKKVGKFFADRKDTTHPILVTTYSSLEKFAQTINPETVGLLLLDEGHHAVSDKRMEIVRRFSNACQYGMTATPDYSEDRTLKNLLENTIAHVDIRQGIYDGILSPFSNIILSSKFQLDLSKVKRTGTGEYDTADYHQAFSRALSPLHAPNTEDTGWQDAHRKIAREVALFYQSMAPYKKHCLINCHTQEEAQIQAEEINKVFGFTQAGVWTSDSKNTHALSDFESGKLGALCQVGMLQEGYDFPALDMCINYPTASWVRATQRGGRTLRLDPQNPSKQATIVDMVFTYPGSRNPYTSARRNNQVLYSDVVNAIYVAPKSLSTAGQGYSISYPETIKLDLKHFKIVSDVKTLLTLKRQDRQKEAAEYVPPKQPGMMSANEIADIWGGTPNKYLELFQKIYDDKTLNVCHDKNNETFELIHRVKSGKCVAFCLSDHPEAMAFFSKICETWYQRRCRENIPLEDYAKGQYLPIKDFYTICQYLSRFKFKIRGENGSQRSLFSKRQMHPDELLLADSEAACRDLNAMVPLTDYLWRLPPMPDDMCDLELFKNKMMIKTESIAPFIKQAILKEKTYTDKNGQKKPLARFYAKTYDDEPKVKYCGICVPGDVEGQTALLRFCGFDIFHCDVSKVTQRSDFWDIYKRSKQNGETMRDIGHSLNVSGARIQQIIFQIQRKLMEVLERPQSLKENIDSYVLRRPTEKEALYISDSTGDCLLTQRVIFSGGADFRHANYYPGCYASLQKEFSQIIKWDRQRRMQGREIE